MLKPEQVPEQAAKAAREAMLAGWSDVHQIIAAALNAWPGMWVLHQTDEDYIPPRNDLILPLPQEATNG